MESKSDRRNSNLTPALHKSRGRRTHPPLFLLDVWLCRGHRGFEHAHELWGLGSRDSLGLEGLGKLFWITGESDR